MAAGLQLMGVQPNLGDLLKDGDILTTGPRELRFNFNQGQVIDEATLGAIQVTRSGGDFQFSAASARTDFNTASSAGGQVIVQFDALQSGQGGNDITLSFSKSDFGRVSGPRVTVEGKSIFVELNTFRSGRTTAADLVTTLNNHAQAGQLIKAFVASGPSSTDIATPAINYSPVSLSGANSAQVTSGFGTGTALEIEFTAVQPGPDSNGLRIVVTKRAFGGAGSPVVTLVNNREIRIELNSNAANPTTAEQLVSAFNATPAVSPLVVARLAAGNPTTNIAAPATTAYSPLVLSGSQDIPIVPGYVGLADSAREVIFRFAEPLPDDLYRIDIQGSGDLVLRNDAGMALGDLTDDGVDNGKDFALQFELDLGAQILGVVPQPIIRTTSGVLAQSSSQIEVYFNNDDLDPVTATNPAFYQLIHTRGTVQSTDDIVYLPIAVQYFPESDRAMLTFRAPLHQLGGGEGSFRLRIGTDESQPAPPVAIDLTEVEVGTSFATARNLGMLSESFLVSSAISPQVFTLDLPGANDEPGHRDISEQLANHLAGSADTDGGITTVYYNFRTDYGLDANGGVLSNLISPEQRQRAREAFELWGQAIGVQFVETATQGITVARGDMRALDPAIATGTGGVLSLSDISPYTGRPVIILDNAENWYDLFGASDDPARPDSFFEIALREIGHVLGLGDTEDLPPYTTMGDSPALAFGQDPEAVYPGAQDVVHGQHLYRPDGRDIDFYRVQVPEAGRLSVETIAERMRDSSLLDSVVSLYREADGQRELIARNDDYFSNDSHLDLHVEAGSYYVGISASGNVGYNPLLEDTGFGGTTEGAYDLRLTFRPAADNSILDLDNASNAKAPPLAQATPLDGDGDGVPGGVFNYWFQVDATPIIVDRTAVAGGIGTLTSPYNRIDTALNAARPGDVVRIVGNGGTDGNLATPADALPYEIGFNELGNPLRDGSTVAVPRGVHLMIDRGAVLKLRRARIGVGSSSATLDLSGGSLQVLGTPRLLDVGGNVVRDAEGNAVPGSVYFTSWNDETLGGDSNPAKATVGQPGDWGGVVFRNDIDRASGRFEPEQAGIFLNYVNAADMRYGGGTVVLGGVAQVIAPIHATDARPTVTHNTIAFSADAAISANPNSFEETNFHDPRYQAVPFTADYDRVGPDVHGNTVTDNSINALFVRLRTPAGDTLQKMTVAGRFDDTDIVHVLSETLRVEGSPGGPIQNLVAPDIRTVSLQKVTGGTIPADIYNYRLTFVDANGQESPSSDLTANVLVNGLESVRLSNLPLPPAPYIGRRLYRSVKEEFVLVAELNATVRTYVDTGAELGGLLRGSSRQLTARLHGRLAVDPGTVVKLNGSGIETAFGSQLIAEGRVGDEVIFTSLQDDRYGAGGTFETNAREDLQAGDWTGLYLGHASSASLDHAVVAYGGGVSEVPGNFAAFNALEIHQAQVRVTNSVFEHNAGGTGGQSTENRAGRGANGPALVYVRGAQPVLVSNVIRDNQGPVVSIDLNSLNHELVEDAGRSTGSVDRIDDIADNRGPLVRDNRLTRNELNGMQVRGGTLTTEGVWDDVDIVHIVQDQTIYVPDFHSYGGLRLRSSADASLVVKLEGANAGFTATGQPLDITDRIGGSLQVVGQDDHPVVLTSLNDCTVGAGFTPDGRPQNATRPAACGVVDLPDIELGPLEIEQVTTVANTLRDALLGPGVIPVGNATFVGGATAAGIFTTGLSSIGIETGVILASGDVAAAVGPNTNGAFSSLSSGVGDPQLDAEFGLPQQLIDVTSDTTYLQFDFQLDPTASQDLFFNFVFASEEYNEFANTPFNDVFAFFVDGQNVAFLPNTTTPISINTVNGGNPFGIGAINPQSYNNNDPFDGGQFLNLFGYDGFTEVFVAQALGIGPGTHTIKLAISDVSDTAWDAAVFLQAGSFSNEIVQGIPAAPGDWRSIELTQYANDRDFAVATEAETGRRAVPGANETPEDAQVLGSVAPYEKAADVNRRLGFEVQGSINRPADVDVYAFKADAGTEVWLDLDQTSQSLDSVVELVDGDGNVLARSDNSVAEAADASLLFRNASVMAADSVNPLNKSLDGGQDHWTINPRDAGMRVVLPGAAGTSNTYYVRVRSSGPAVENVQGGITTGAYQLQIRLREENEIPGSAITGADIRFATIGIELTGLPAHSQLTGEAGELIDAATGSDTNNSFATPDVLGNLLQSERGTLSVAGALAAAGDVDWYQFDVQYTALAADKADDVKHLPTVFDIDYADGFSRANTNLWVFDSLGQLVLSGGDSNVSEDRPAGTEGFVEELARGSLGSLDPFIGTVELPAPILTPGRYYVAVTSNARIPEELQQYFAVAATNPNVRLEPVNSVKRIAEDRIASPGFFTTAEAPEIPVLFGDDDRVTLYPPDGGRLRDGERFTITNHAGNSATYEFDNDGLTPSGNVAIAFLPTSTALEISLAISSAIQLSPPDPGSFQFPTAGNPSVYSSLTAFTSFDGGVLLTESVFVQTLLSDISRTSDFTSFQKDPQVRQLPAPGRSQVDVLVSRPAAATYNLGDVTLFVTQEGQQNRMELVSIDPFTGQLETRVGAFGANVGDIAMHPRGGNPGVGNEGGLFGFSIPETNPQDDATTGNYWQVNPSLTTPGNLGENLGDDGIETYIEDPANPGAAIRAQRGNNKNGVGIRFQAITFSDQDSAQGNNVRGFAIGSRDDFAFGIPNPTNVLFEFNPNTGAAFNPPGVQDRKDAGLLTAGGTQIWDRGALNTATDAFPVGGTNTSITGVDATIPNFFGSSIAQIEDGDFFEIDQDGDGLGDIAFEFDTGPEFLIALNSNNPAALQVLRDGDSFTVDGDRYEFDTGTVILINAQNGAQLRDGDILTISDNAQTPVTLTFEFDSNNQTAGGNVSIPFTNTSNQQAIITSLIAAINNSANFGVTAVQLPGTNRITLIGESVISGATTNALGLTLVGNPGVSPTGTRIPVEETMTETAVGQAIAGVIDGTQPGGYVAGAAVDRLNFEGALTVDFTGVTNQAIFTARGVPGTLNNFALPIPFLADDNSADIAQRVHLAITTAGFGATVSGASVFLDPVIFPNIQPIFVCISLGIPPLIGAPGIPDCPLLSGGVAPGGEITGMAFVGQEMFAVTDTGGLFRIANFIGGSFFGNSTQNVADYIDGSRERLQAANTTTTFVFDPITGSFIEVETTEPIRFSGLVAGPDNTEDARYKNLLFGITDDGRLFAFDTFGNPQPVFGNGAYFADSDVFGANGVAFSNLDDTLWHVTGDRRNDDGHGVQEAFDDSRLDEIRAGNTSLYFGYESPQEQSQFGSQNFAPATPANTYDFPGGSHGSLVSNSFSLEGYSAADKPTLYFNYFLETEQADATSETSLLNFQERMRDSFRVFVSGDDGGWKLLSTNNSDRDAPPDDDYFDEFDPFNKIDGQTGAIVPEQPFRRGEAFENIDQWRQVRVDLSPYAGQDNLRLRFDFATAGGMSTGGNDITVDLNTAGNELRAIPGAELRDGQMFTLTGGLFGSTAAVFEFELGPTIVAPTGAAVDDGDLFAIDGRVYEFDRDGSVGATDNVPHTPVPFSGTETAGQLAELIAEILDAAPPPPAALTGDIAEPSDTLATAFVSGLNGTTQEFTGRGEVGDNFTLVDFTLDVDLIEVHLDAGDVLVAATDTTQFATQLDTYLRLFDSAGVQLTSNDNADPTNPFSRDSRVVFSAARTGTYYVGVSAAHNSNYDPAVAESGGGVGGVTTTGLYDVGISVTDPVSPQRVGNRLNLPNAGTITTVGLPDNFVEGAAGVSPGIPIGGFPPQFLPVTPVRIHAGMTNLLVADAIREAIAQELAGGNVEAIKQRHEVIQIVGYGIGDAGPLGLSGPSDPTTALLGTGLFGDLFGAFDRSAGFNGQTTAGTPGAERMWNNRFEGVYIDDILIGFAERGEMVTGSQPSQGPVFTPNPGQLGGEINQGAYQLEIRQATQYGRSISQPDPSVIVHPSLELYDTFLSNDRLAGGVTIVAGGGELLADGQTLSVSDGQTEVIFEFDDLTIGDGVAAGHTAISFDPSDSDVVIARRIRDAINSAPVQEQLDVRAASSDGPFSGTASTSPQVHLFGNAVVTMGLLGRGINGSVPVAESNDALTTATDTGIVGGGREGYRSAGFIGDNPAVAPFGADVDLFRFDLLAGELITIDIDATEDGSPLDSMLRIFDASGAAVTLPGVPTFPGVPGLPIPIESDDDVAPGESAILYPLLVENRDSYLAFRAPLDGTYYVGVSGFDNHEYDPAVEGSGRRGTTGGYTIEIQRPLNSNGLAVIEQRGQGDKNLEREQGQILIENNRISRSAEFGIAASAGPRGVGGAPSPGPVRNLSVINTSRLVPGVVIENNILARNTLGGIDMSGDTVGAGLQPAVIPFGRIVNNTIVGNSSAGGTTAGDVGIRLSSGVSPTLLNNVFSSLATGIDLDASSATTVIGGSLYHNNGANTVGTGLGDFPILVAPATQLWVNEARGNYYPAVGSPVIDSSIDSLEDRPELILVQKPLGIPESPILAPERDASGQLRVDDPNVAPPPGFGENIFKDRGALDRADFVGPTSSLISPLDNGPNDLDPTLTQVNLVKATLDEFSIQLSDQNVGSGGIGIDDTTVNGGVVRVTQDSRVLVEGVDYIFDYDPTNNIIRLTPLSGLWDQESNYVIEIIREDRFVLTMPSGDVLADGVSFEITGDNGQPVTFEFDSGYVIHVPQTYAIQIPRAGGGLRGVADGDRITVSDGVRTAVIEFDSNGATAANSVVVRFTPQSTQGEIADTLVAALTQAGVGLSPRNVGSGLVHLGVNGTQTVTVASTTVTLVGVQDGVNDGETFQIDDFTRLVTFEFTTDAVVSVGNRAVQFTYAQTHEQIAAAIATAVNNAGVGMNAQALEDGKVQLGGGLNHQVDVSNSSLTLTGEPGVRQEWGFRIPTEAGRFQNLVTDGETFTISNTAGVSVTFEFDIDNNITPGNTSIPYTSNTTTAQLANTLVSRIRNASDGPVPLGLFPFYAGNAIVTLGGDATYAIDLINSSLVEVGQPGVPAAVAIPFTPSESFTPEQVAEAVAKAINVRQIVDVSAVAVGDEVNIVGAAAVTVPTVDDDLDPDTPEVAFPLGLEFGSTVKDLAGNILEGNQIDGTTRFTIFIGAGMDYGDAPDSYRTLRASDGARHIILDGFSLGAIVTVDADGKPSAGANADSGDDGVFFNSSTPLIPNRPFSLTVTTQGVGSVVPFAVLDAWVDWNRDGDWGDSGERMIANQILNTSNLSLGAITFPNLVVPAAAVPGLTYARFRLSSEANPLPGGEAVAGEVEDYAVTINANPWQNSPNPLDVNNNGAVSPTDVLLVINYINDHPNNLVLPLPKPPSAPFYDVNGDGAATAIDTLLIINYINEQNSQLGAGEGESIAYSGRRAAVGQHLDDVLALDADWDALLEDVDQATQPLDARDAIFAGMA